MQFVTDQKLHTCTYQSTFRRLMDPGSGEGRARKREVSCVGVPAGCAGVCACVACAAVFAALRIFNWKCYRIYEIVNMHLYSHLLSLSLSLSFTLSHLLSLSLSFSHSNTPTPAQTSTHIHPPAGVDDTHIWHIYIQLVCKCKFPSPASPSPATPTAKHTINTKKNIHTQVGKVKCGKKNKLKIAAMATTTFLVRPGQMTNNNKEYNFGKCINQIWNMY